MGLLIAPSGLTMKILQVPVTGTPAGYDWDRRRRRSTGVGFRILMKQDDEVTLDHHSVWKKQKVEVDYTELD